MDQDIALKKRLCEGADNAEWGDRISTAQALSDDEKRFIEAHPPGLVAALWAHFEATRDVCGCRTPAHERADCPAGLIERLLLEQESQ